METSQPLSLESFSFKWVINLKPSPDGVGDDSFRVLGEAACSLELEPSRVPSWRYLDFNFPTSQPPSMLVHADELFSNGHFLPPSSKQDTLCTSNSPPTPSSNQTRPRGSFLGRCWRSWRRVVKKQLSFLKHTSQKVQDSSFGSRADSIAACLQVDVTDNELCEETSSQTSRDYFIGDWSDIEKSIQDAVLHCKRSSEKRLTLADSKL